MKRFATVLLCAALLALLYGVSRLLATIDVTVDAWTIVLVLAALYAGALLVGLFAQFPGRANFAVMVAALTVAFAAGNWALRLAGRDLIAIFDAKVAHPLAQAKRSETQVAVANASVPAQELDSSKPVDSRNELEVSKDLTAAGIDHQQMRVSPLLLPVMNTRSGQPFFPLSMGSNAVTIACNEGDQRDFPIWRTDRYGYNNDDAVYSRRELIMIAGGSFALGSCVHTDENLAGVLRRNGYPAFSAGIGQFGPIATLATLKEYGTHLKPKTVLWQYFDPNDVALLPRRELRSTILLQYLKPDFSQDLIHRQREVDEFWKNAGPLIEAYEQGFLASPEAQAAWETRLDENLPLVREVLGNDITSLRDDDNVLRIYERVFTIAQRRVSSWGGKIFLVIIPNNDTYFSGSVPKYQVPVARIMRNLNIPIIDVDPVMRATGDPLQFYPRRGMGAAHFNAKGYALAARQIMAVLDAAAPSPVR
jgi:hypothetical protein